MYEFTIINRLYHFFRKSFCDVLLHDIFVHSTLRTAQFDEPINKQTEGGFYSFQPPQFFHKFSSFLKIEKSLLSFLLRVLNFPPIFPPWAADDRIKTKQLFAKIRQILLGTWIFFQKTCYGIVTET